ncbi:7636_t:CDS:2, partial [Gigaspora margarita]
MSQREEIEPFLPKVKPEKRNNWLNLTSLQELKDQLEMEKLGAAVKLVDLKKQIDDKTSERDAKQTELTAKETAIDTLIKEIITKKREQLAPYNISKGFAKTTAEDNRRGVHELYQIQTLLQEIRYLENDGNPELPSSNDDENTALTEIETILTAEGKLFLIGSFENLTYVKDSQPNIQQAISRIKDGKYTDGKGQEHRIGYSLEKIKEHFTKKAELVKLSSIKKHNKIADIEKLIKKVIGTDNKVKPEFLEEIKKSDATLTDLKTLLQKEPKEIITYIARFVYNQLDDSASEEKDKKQTQMKRRIAKKLNKSKE